MSVFETIFWKQFLKDIYPGCSRAFFSVYTLRPKIDLSFLFTESLARFSKENGKRWEYSHTAQALDITRLYAKKTPLLPFIKKNSGLNVVQTIFSYRCDYGSRCKMDGPFDWLPPGHLMIPLDLKESWKCYCAGIYQWFRNREWSKCDQWRW